MARQCHPDLAELTRLCRTLRKNNASTRVYFRVHQISFCGKGPVTAPPSRTERLRFLRSVYRFQTLINAWVVPHPPDDQAVRLPLGLFVAFEPWEQQQVADAIYRLCQHSEPASAIKFLRSKPVVLNRHGNVELRSAGSLRPQRSGALEPKFDSSDVLRMYSKLLGSPDAAKDQREQQQQDGGDGGDSGDSGDGGDGGGGATVDFVGDALDLPPFGWTDALDRRFTHSPTDTVHPALVSDAEGEHSARTESYELWRNVGFAFWDRGAGRGP